MTNRQKNRFRLLLLLLLLVFLLVGAHLLLRRKAPLSPAQAAEAPTQETLVLFEGEHVTTEDALVRLSDREVVLPGPGPYLLRGALEGRCLHVAGKGDILLILDGLEIRTDAGEALLSDKSCALTLRLAEGSQNTFVSGTERELLPEKEASGAALDARGDLTISGGGALCVQGYINNAVRCRADLRLEGGAQLELRAANRGIRSDMLSLSGADCRIFSGAEGVYTERSFLLKDGSLTVSAAGHGIRSDGGVGMEGGRLELWSSEGHGIKAEGEVALSGGELLLDALEDGIDSSAGIELACTRALIRAGGDALKCGGAGSADSPVLRLLSGEILISSYGRPIRTDGSCQLARGVSLLAAGIVGPGAFPSMASAQPLGFQTPEGSKHELLGVLLDGEVRLRMEAAYGYNLVIYSLPEAAGTEQMKLVIEK